MTGVVTRLQETHRQVNAVIVNESLAICCLLAVVREAINGADMTSGNVRHGRSSGGMNGRCLEGIAMRTEPFRPDGYVVKKARLTSHGTNTSRVTPSSMRTYAESHGAEIMVYSCPMRGSVL